MQMCEVHSLASSCSAVNCLSEVYSCLVCTKHAVFDFACKACLNVFYTVTDLTKSLFKNIFERRVLVLQAAELTTNCLSGIIGK